jgi:hypothetical protein
MGLTSLECFIVRSIHDHIWKCHDAIPVKHSLETSHAGLELYRYFISSHVNLNPVELTRKKHDLFVAVLCLGETCEKKVGCPLDQVLLANSLSIGSWWCKSSLVLSSVVIQMWCLKAINAHWCQLAITEEETYVPYSREDACQAINLALEPPDDTLQLADLHELDAMENYPDNEPDVELEGEGRDRD